MKTKLTTFIFLILMITSCNEKVRVNQLYKSQDGCSGRVIDVRNEDDIVEVEWYTAEGGIPIVGTMTSKMDMNYFKKNYKLVKESTLSTNR